ncbi:hypothetical protein GF357_00680 [Candidatus Dojkabacteria bacterium]|nr:hypothetical protein [Candidatus Dojkabacteria bacterium]
MILKRKPQIPISYIIIAIIILIIAAALILSAYINQRKNLGTIINNQSETETIIVDTINLCIDTTTDEFEMITSDLSELENELKVKLKPLLLASQEQMAHEKTENPNKTPETASELTEQVVSQCHIRLNKDPDETFQYTKVWSKYFTIATQLSNPHNQISTQQLQDAIENHSYKTYPVVWTEEADSFIRANFEPGDKYNTYEADELIDQVAASGLTSDPAEWHYIIIPFEKTTSKLQTVLIADNPVFSVDFNLEAYQLKSSYYVSIESDEVLPFSDYKQFKPENLANTFRKHLLEALGPENFNPSETFTAAITGKSNIGAGIQAKQNCPQCDSADPITKNLSPVLQLLNNTDLVLINNESPITEDCEIYPAPTQYLCGKPESLKALKSVLTTKVIVDAAGYDIFDFGRQGFNETLEDYSRNDIEYFAAGKNSKEAKSPLKFNHSESELTLGFLGYDTNPLYAGFLAGTNYGGNASTYGNIRKDISQMEASTDFAVIDIHNPFTYSNEIEPYNLAPTRSFIDAGGDIVIVVNSPVVKPMEIYEGKAIFYGIGSFLTANPATDSETSEEARNDREGVIVKLNFYSGEYTGYQLFPIYINSRGQITLADSSKKIDILNKIYNKRP